MGCGGCRSDSRSIETADARARAVRCHLCPHGQAIQGLTICTINGDTIGYRELHQPQRTCPLKRWPDESGKVRWLGMKWRGLPWPLRIRIALEAAVRSFRKRMEETRYPGCGCHDRIKSLIERIRKARKREAT